MVGMLIKKIKEDRNLQIFLGIFIFAAILRFFQLTQEGLWYDEVLTALSMKMSFMDMVRDRLAGGHSPFYFIIVYPFCRIFGNNEFMVRLPSVLASILSVYAFYVLARKLFSDVRPANLATLFFSISALQIYFAGEARMYAFVVLFVIMSFYFLLRALDENDWKIWLCYVLSTAGFFYLSAATIPIIFAQIVYVLLKRKKYADYLLAFSFIVLLYVPMAYFYLSMKKLGFIEWLPPITINTFIQILYGFGFYPVPVYQAGNITQIYLAVAKALSLLLLGGLIIFALFASFIRRSREGKELFSFYFDKDSNAALISALWLIVPLIAMATYSLLRQPIFGPKRYVIALAPAYYLLLSIGVMKIGRGFVRKTIAIILTVFFILALITFYNVPTREDWKGAISYVESNSVAEEVIVGDVATSKAYEYYGKREIKVMPPMFFNMATPHGKWILLKSMDFQRNFGSGERFKESFDVVEEQKFNGLRLFYVK